MKTTGILFKADMVRAILSGTKTLTSRLRGLDQINARPNAWRYDGLNIHGDHLFTFIDGLVAGQDPPESIHVIRCCYGGAGDRLIGRETFYVNDGLVSYRADEEMPNSARRLGCKWTPSIHMPFQFSRLHLEITRVWPSRLQNMTEEEAVQEGVAVTEAHRMNEQLFDECRPDLPRVPAAVEAYAELWDRINGAKPGRRWADNPYVWRIMFERMSFSPAVVVPPEPPCDQTQRCAPERGYSNAGECGGDSARGHSTNARPSLDHSCGGGRLLALSKPSMAGLDSGGPPLPP